jgi:hypothetical protein
MKGDDDVMKGWEGNPKVMLQILWEHGWINEADGCKDLFRNIVASTAMKLLTTRQMDFVQEETLLQYHGQFLASLLTGRQSSIRRWHGRALSMTEPKGSTVAHLWQRGKKQKEVP